MKNFIDFTISLAIAQTCVNIANSLELNLIEQEVAKQLGRPLTSWHRDVCLREYRRKQEWDRWQAQVTFRNQSERDVEVIRRIVWRRSNNG